MSMERDGMIIESILGSESDLLAASECHRLYPSALERLVGNRTKIINEYCAEQEGLKELEWQSAGRYQRAHNLLLHCHSSKYLREHNLGVLAEGHNRAFNNVTYGLYWLDPTTKTHPWTDLLHSRLCSGIQAGKSNYYNWFWMAEDTEWTSWTTPEMLAALLRKELTEPEKFCIKIYSVVEAFFKENPNL